MFRLRLFLALAACCGTLAASVYADDQLPPGEPTELTGTTAKAGVVPGIPLTAVAERLDAAEKADDFPAMLSAAEEALTLAPEHLKERFARKVALAAWWHGHSAFGNADWQQAADRFGRISELAGQYPRIAKSWGPNLLDSDTHLQLAQRMLTLPRRQPDYTHRFLLVFLHDVSLDQPGLHANRITGRTILNEQQKSRARHAFSALRGYLESLSQGRLSATFTTLEYSGSVKALRIRPDGTSGEIREPDLNHAAPSLWPLLRDRYQQVDTIVYIWGGGEKFAQYATGGSLPHVLIPWTLASPLRGFIQIPGHRLINSYAPLLVMHEFFHTVESMSGIKPNHGYKPAVRSQFPDWKGTSQLDYYRWHFDTTIPQRFSTKSDFKPERGWANLNFPLRHPDRLPPLQALDQLASRADLIPSVDRQKASKLHHQAEALIKDKQDNQALPLLLEAKQLHPLHPGIMLELGRLYERTGQLQDALEAYRTRADFFPDLGGVQRIAALNQKLALHLPAAKAHVWAADLATTPGTRLIHLLLSAHAYKRAADHQAAFTAYQQVIKEAPKLSPNDTKLLAEAYYQSGLLLADHLGTPQEGIKLLQQAVASGHNPELVQKSLARISKKIR
ncbi:MAG: tetratricopeptide repeat protein [Geobacteraceae bacterium]|nr:tetratricopeptide repeat protein [Geobacteraceae bacterium]